jgi:hypothetical protein
MPRIAPILILALAGWIASDTGSASAQVNLPKCDPRVNDRILRAGGFPDWAGCRYVEAARILGNYDYQPKPQVDKSVVGIPRGFVIRQSRDGGLVILFVSTGAGYAPPVKPTPEPTPTPDPAPAPTPQPPQIPRPKFSIHAPPKVQEGEPLIFTVHREGSDERAHRITLSPNPRELLKRSPTPFDFGPDRTDEVVTVETAPGQPGDGDHTLQIGLASDESADVGDPQPATIQVIDTPATTYEIVAPVNVERGQALTFRVDRRGPSAPSELTYEIQQGPEIISPDGLPHPLRFAAEDTSKLLELKPDFYSVCGPPPTLILRDGAGREVAASASFSGPPPEACNPPPPTLLEWLQENAPWWPIPAALLGLGAVAYVGRKIWRRIWPGTVPVLYPTWGIEAGPTPPELDAPHIPGWPKFSTSVTVEWGGAIVPQPLPIAETKDG